MTSEDIGCPAGEKPVNQRSRTDRHVTQPSSFSSSAMFTATTRSPRCSNFLRVWGATRHEYGLGVQEYDVGAGFLRHWQKAVPALGVVDKGRITDDAAVWESGDGGLQVQHLGHWFTHDPSPLVSQHSAQSSTDLTQFLPSSS